MEGHPFLHAEALAQQLSGAHGQIRAIGRQIFTQPGDGQGDGGLVGIGYVVECGKRGEDVVVHIKGLENSIERVEAIKARRTHSQGEIDLGGGGDEDFAHGYECSGR